MKSSVLGIFLCTCACSVYGGLMGSFPVKESSDQCLTDELNRSAYQSSDSEEEEYPEEEETVTEKLLEEEEEEETVREKLLEKKLLKNELVDRTLDDLSPAIQEAVSRFEQGLVLRKMPRLLKASSKPLTARQHLVALQARKS